MRKPLRHYLPDYTFLLSIAGITILLDQVTKRLVQANLSFTDVWTPFEWLAPYARIVHWKNTGAAFGIFQNGSLLISVLAFLVSIAILNFFPVIPRSDRWLRTAVALQMGGAVGNLLDRLTLGYVVDFISVFRLPVFNFSDVGIFTGVILILIPAIPHLMDERDEAQLMRRSKELNGRRRLVPRNAGALEDPVSLGILEVLFSETDIMRRFRMRQDIRRIRQGAASLSKGSRRG